MRRLIVCAAAVTAMAIGSVVVAQSPIATADDYQKVMRSNSQAFGATNKAIASSAFADTKTQLATVRQNFVALQAFWADKKKDDAVAIVKDGIVKLDALNAILSGAAPDQMAAQAAAKTFQGQCGACHQAYREGNAQEGFKFKAGVM